MSEEKEEVILIVGGGYSYATKLIRLLDSLATVELVHLGGLVDSQGNSTGGLICARSNQMFPLDDVLSAEAIASVQFELTRPYDDTPYFYYQGKEDTRNRNKAWKEFLKRANQRSKIRSKRK